MTFTVRDIDLSQIASQKYDLAVFASGYEARCTHAPRCVEGVQTSDVLVVGFANISEDAQRLANDSYFRDVWRKDPLVLDAGADGSLYAWLNNTSARDSDELRLLVDYSSMSRLWYAAILNWARYSDRFKRVVVDMLYSVGRYEDEPVQIVIDDIIPIPGCEGGALRFGTAVAVFGLGYPGIMAECVLEHLEPDVVYAYLASPGASPSYPDRVKEANGFLIEHADAVVEIPLCSVETTMEYLTDLVTPHRAESEIVLVPMGPKPHVLGAILVSMNAPDVSCLRVSAERTKPEKVLPKGEIVATRVTSDSTLPERTNMHALKAD